ncbi:uncharacterized protein LOC111241449 [Vigna radiata var. radiata]|uniref:Uncharacterized protein LOC111241449 n=1 Tax=Vigna radiata var. radiata TaxID=3916 RepID=A0A3Q0EVM0_VIGRR|nr:uncharacterized protein LOC111241449 [Vigna radiata var. radiata]
MSEDRFKVVVHYGGTLIKDVFPFKYLGGQISSWDIDPDTWSYFGVVATIKEMGYMEVQELVYSIDNILHGLYDDRGAMNMMEIAKSLGKVDLYIVHKVSEPDFVETENEILYLCQGRAESGDGIGFEADAEENEEVENQCVVEEVGDKLDTHAEVEVEEVQVEEETVEEVEVEAVEEVAVEEVEVEAVEEEVEVDAGEEVEEEENSSEEEVEVDEVEVDEVEVDEVQLENNSEEDAEDYMVGRGLSDDDSEAEELLTPGNSDSEEDEIQDKPSRCPFPTFGKKKSMLDYKWEVGTIFNDKEDFKEAIRNYAIHAGRDLKFVKNDKRRVRVRCMGAQKKCQWVAYLGYLPSKKVWQLRKVLDTHCCSRQLNIKMMNSKWLSNEVDKVLHDNPTIKVQDIRNKALRKWNTKVSISKARRAKLMATNEREGDFKEQFRRLHDYGHELLRSNPGSTVKIKVNSDNGEAIFERIYVCLNACKKSFVSCRPITFLDECFLKRSI